MFHTLSYIIYIKPWFRQEKQHNLDADFDINNMYGKKATLSNIALQISNGVMDLNMTSGKRSLMYKRKLKRRFTKKRYQQFILFF